MRLYTSNLARRPQNALSPEFASKIAKLRWAKHRDVLPPPRPADERKAAAKAAEQKKFHGSDCLRNHGGLRYTKTGQCVQCVNFKRDNKEQQ